MIPRAFVGSAEDGGIYALHHGYKDGGEVVDFRARSSPIAPEGAHLDYGFNRVLLTLTWSTTTTVVVTPIVDDVEIDDAVMEIELTALPTDDKRSQVFELVLFQYHRVGGDETYKKSLRGTWLRLDIRSEGGLGPGLMIVDEAVLEYDVLGPRKERATQ